MFPRARALPSALLHTTSPCILAFVSTSPSNAETGTVLDRSFGVRAGEVDRAGDAVEVACTSEPDAACGTFLSTSSSCLTACTSTKPHAVQVLHMRLPRADTRCSGVGKTVLCLESFCILMFVLVLLFGVWIRRVDTPKWPHREQCKGEAACRKPRGALRRLREAWRAA